MAPIDDISALTVAAERLIMERVHYYARRSSSITDRYQFLDDAKIDVKILASDADLLVLSLYTYVWGERQAAQKCEVNFAAPSGWWQHLRYDLREWARSYAGFRFLSGIPPLLRWMRGLKVRERTETHTVSFTQYVTYPTYRPKIAKEWCDVVIMSQHRVTE